MSNEDSTAPAARSKRINGTAAKAKPPRELPTAQEETEMLVAALMVKPALRTEFDEIAAIEPGDIFEPAWRTFLQIVVGLIDDGLPMSAKIARGCLRNFEYGTEGQSLYNALGGVDWFRKFERDAEAQANHAIYAADVVKKAALDRHRIAVIRDANMHFENGGDPAEIGEYLAGRLTTIASDEKPPEPLFKIVDADELFNTSYTLQWMVRGILTRNQPGLIAGPKKALKTSIGEELAVCFALGLPFFSKWEVPERLRVLFFSAESGDATIAETCKRIAASKGIDPGELAGWLRHSFTVPQLDNPAHIDGLKRALDDTQSDVLILDPAYLMFGKDTDAKSLFSMGMRLREFNEICASRGVTLLIVHHFRKGRTESDTPQLEDVAYAGFQEFARQWLMLDRGAEYKPGSGHHELIMSWGGSAGYSGEVNVIVDEGVNDGRGGERFWATEIVDRKTKVARKEDAKAKAKQEKLENYRGAVDRAFVSAKGAALTKPGLAELVGCVTRNTGFLEALALMLRERSIETTTVTPTNGITYEAYRREWGGNLDQPPPAEDAAA